jgi:hypothetical protein
MSPLLMVRLARAAVPGAIDLVLRRGAGVARKPEFPVAVEGVVAVAAVNGDEAGRFAGEVLRQAGDERRGGEHGPGFEGFEPEGAVGGE